MADIEQSVVTVLTGLVSGRIYPNKVEQGADLPALVYQSTRTPVPYLHGGLATMQVAITITCVASTFAAARTLAESVRTAMAASALVFGYEEEPGDQFDPETNLHLYSLVYTLWQP
jgi:hypothetical protein